MDHHPLFGKCLFSSPSPSLRYFLDLCRRYLHSRRGAALGPSSRSRSLPVLHSVLTALCTMLPDTQNHPQLFVRLLGEVLLSSFFSPSLLEIVALNPKNIQCRERVGHGRVHPLCHSHLQRWAEVGLHRVPAHVPRATRGALRLCFVSGLYFFYLLYDFFFFAFCFLVFL